MSNISRFLSSIELDNDLDNLSSQGVSKIKSICEDFVGQGGGNIPGGPFIPQTEKSAPFGVAQLDANGKILQSQFDNVSLNHLNDVNIDNTVIDNHVLKWSTQENQWVNDTFNLDDCDNVEITNPLYSDLLFYDSIGQNPPKWVNKNINTDYISEGLNPDRKYFSNNLVETYLKTILTNDGDILTRDTNNNLIKISKGTNNQLLSMNNDASQIIWVNKSDAGATSLNGLSDVDMNNLQHEQILMYNIFTLNFENKTLTTDLIPEGNNNQRIYFTQQRVYDYLLTILGNGRLLFNNNGNIEGLIPGPNGQYIRSNGVTCQYAQINSDEILEGNTNKFYLDSNVSDYLKTILTSSQDLLTRNASNNLIRLAKGANGTILSINNLGLLEWKIPDLPNMGLNDLNDVVINNPIASQSLNFDGNNWINKMLNISDITNLQTELNNKINSNILTTEGDIIYRNNTITTRLPKGTDGQFLKSTTTSIQWDTIPAGKENLSELNDVSILNIANNQFLRYETGNNKWNNRTITTDDIPASLTNKYLTSTDLQTKLLEILTGNEDILIRRAGQIVRLPFSTDTSKYLSSDGTNLIWKTIPDSVQNLTDLLDVSITTPSTGQVLYKSNGDWINQNLGINDITNLQSSLDNKINNLFVNTGDLIIGNGANSYIKLSIGGINTYLKSDGTNISWASVPAGYTDTDVSNYLLTILTTSQDILYRNGSVLARLPKGNDNQILKVVNGNLEYGNIILNLKELNDANITDENLAGWLYWNSTTTEWEKHVISIGNVVNLQTELDGKLSNALFDIQGQADGEVLLYSGVAGKFQNSTLGIDNISQLQTTLDGKIPVNSFSQKGHILVGTGNGTYQEQAQPTADFRILVSDITNNLNNTGLSWNQLALNNSYFSNLNITNPLNTQVLQYDTASGKWTNAAAAITYPLRAPYGTAAAPSYSFALNTNSGMYADATKLILCFAGVDKLWFFADWAQIRTTLGLLNIAGTAGSPSYAFNSGGNNSGFYFEGVNNRIGFSCQGTSRMTIDATSVKVPTRLDIINTLIEDYRVRINNIFNSFAFQNTAGTQTYLQVDTANNRVKCPNRFISEVLKLDTAANINTSITVNNTFFNVALGDLKSITINNNALSTPMSLICVPNTDEITINNAVGIKLHISCSFSMLIDKNVAIIDISIWNMSDNLELSQFHRRFRADANYYLNYSVEGYYTPTLANQRISMKIKCSQGATVIGTLTNLTFNVTDLML